MRKRFRTFFEKLVYAGMKPGEVSPASAPSDPLRWLGPLRGPVDRFLSGGNPNDPLYLTNRSTKRKVLGWVAISLPFVAMVAALYMVASGSFGTPVTPEAAELKPADVAAKLLPNLKDVKLGISHDVVVVDVRITRGPASILSGSVKNTSERRVETAELMFELTDGSGSQIGTVLVKVPNIRSQEIRKFSVPISSRTAVNALIQEIHAR